MSNENEKKDKKLNNLVTGKQKSIALHFQDLSYNFENYFERYGTKAMGVEENEEFNARVIGLFCRDFFQSGGDPSTIQPWVASHLARSLFEVLGGSRFNDVLPMPFGENTLEMTPKATRALDIYGFCKPTPDDKSTLSDRLKKCMDIHCLSYEAVRSDYYSMKAVLEEGKPWPKGFLKT